MNQCNKFQAHNSIKWNHSYVQQQNESYMLNRNEKLTATIKKKRKVTLINSLEQYKIRKQHERVLRPLTYSLISGKHRFRQEIRAS